MIIDQLERIAGTLLKAARTVVPILLRLWIGYAFFKSGLGKLKHLDDVTQFFESIHIPLPGLNAHFIAALEFTGGLMLIAGAVTRVFSFLLSCTMVVAILSAEWDNLMEALTPGGDKNLVEIVPFVYLMVLLAILAFGPGLLSVDPLLSKKLPQRIRALLGIDPSEV